jgi:hypothetical protein
MRWVRLTLALIGLVIGVFMFWGGEWLVWDWINSIVNGPWLKWDEFCSGWIFYAPLFLYKWTCEVWTAVFDLGKFFLDAGLLLTIISAFSLGLLVRPVVEAFIKKIRGKK